MSSAAITPVAGRHCDSCAMCCRLLKIPELNKLEGDWCQHCTTRRSCNIYESRPAPCRTYYCYFMTNEKLGEEWRPSKCHFIISPKQDGKLAVISVNPDRPDAWKKEPFLSTFKRWSTEIEVLVHIRRQMYRIQAGEIIDLGIVPDTD